MKTMKTISEILALGPVVPVLTIDDLETAVPLARALAAGGLPAIEVTLRTAASPAAIKAIAAEVPEAVVGAGTILNPKHYEEAVTRRSALHRQPRLHPRADPVREGIGSSRSCPVPRPRRKPWSCSAPASPT